tara:strand:+ start:523 stop:852 length:330 start_codon:yes stop_codon:yes gene_type:complete
LTNTMTPFQSNDSNSPMLPTPSCISNEDLAHKIDQLTTVVYKVHGAVVGDPNMGHKGLAQRVEEAELFAKTHEKKLDEHDRKFWLAGVLFSIVGTAALFLKDFFAGNKS